MQSEPPTFHQFAQLPYEIRHLIWSHFLPQSPQIIHIFEHHLKSTQRQFHLEGYPCLAIDSDIPAPTELFACREAYSLLAEWGPRFSCSTKNMPQTLFHARDTLYLSRVSQAQLDRHYPDDNPIPLPSSATLISPMPLLRTMVGNEQLRCVRNLAIDLYSWDTARLWNDGLEEYLVVILRHFPCLVSLTLVYEYIEPCLAMPGSSAFASLRNHKCRDDLVFIDQDVVKAAVRCDELLEIFSPDAPHLVVGDYLQPWGKIKDMEWLCDLKGNHAEAAKRGYQTKEGQEGFFSVTGVNYPQYLQGWFTDEFMPGVTHQLPSIEWKYVVTREHGARLEEACEAARNGI